MTETLKKGFTLVEVVIVIGLFGAAVAALVVMYTNFSGLYGLGQSTARTASEARNVMEEVEAMVLPATIVLDSRTFSTGTYESGTTTVVTELPSIDSSGAIINGRFDYAVVYLQGGKVYRRLEADAASVRRTGTKQLSEASTTLSFMYNNVLFTDVTAITASTSVSTITKGQTIDTVLQSTFMLRNYND